MRPFLFPPRATAAAVALFTAAAVVFAQRPATPKLAPPSDVAAPNGSATQPEMNTGVNPRSPEKTGIQQLLAQTVEAALSKDEVATLASYLSTPDQKHLDDLRAVQWRDLDGRIEEFRKDWRAKFGIDFKLTDKQSVVFADDSFPIRAGNEAGENATNGGNVAAPGGQGGAGTASPSAASQPSAFANLPPLPPPPPLPGDGMGANASDAEPAMVRHATVQLPATPTAASEQLKLVNEGQVVAVWKIDLPATITPEQLHDSLLNRVTRIDQHKYSWPTEINEAYQAISREILDSLQTAAGPATQP